MSGTYEQILLLDHDPDLGADLTEDELRFARRTAAALLERRPIGPWEPEKALRSSLCGIVLDGLVVRELAVAGTVSADVLGPGDVVLAPEEPEVSLVPASIGWVVLEPLSVAWLGEHFEQSARRWPQLSRAVLQRMNAGATRAAFLQNVAQLNKIEDRVLLLLWLLAERFGRVGSAGVVLPLRLTHRVIARLIGSRRPSVTTAIVALERAGRLQRRADGAFVLYAEPEPRLVEAVEPVAPWGRRGIVLDAPATAV
jgi:CRP/FNR family transcriptional regulator, cyclic AMP receptor protein